VLSVLRCNLPLTLLVSELSTFNIFAVSSISCRNDRPKLTRLSLNCAQFHTFLLYLRLVNIFVLGVGGYMLRIVDWRPTNSLRVPRVLYLSMQLNSRIDCSNQMITSSFFICSGSIHVNIPVSFSM